MRSLLALVLATLALALVRAARADFPTLYGGDLSCAEQAANGERPPLRRRNDDLGRRKPRSTSTWSCRRSRAPATTDPIP